MQLFIETCRHACKYSILSKNRVSICSNHLWTLFAITTLLWKLSFIFFISSGILLQNSWRIVNALLWILVLFVFFSVIKDTRLRTWGMGFKESSEWLKLPLCIVLPRYAFTSLAVYLGSLPCGKDDANQTLSRWCYWIKIWQHLFALIIPSILTIIFLTTTVWNAVPNHYRHRLCFTGCALNSSCILCVHWWSFDLEIWLHYSRT